MHSPRRCGVVGGLGRVPIIPKARSRECVLYYLCDDDCNGPVVIGHLFVHPKGKTEDNSSQSVTAHRRLDRLSPRPIWTDEAARSADDCPTIHCEWVPQSGGLSCAGDLFANPLGDTKTNHLARMTANALAQMSHASHEPQCEWCARNLPRAASHTPFSPFRVSPTPTCPPHIEGCWRITEQFGNTAIQSTQSHLSAISARISE